MAGGYGRSLEETPTWAVAVVCFVLVTISIFIEYILHLIGKWLKSKHKRALFESLEKVKAELMLLGFISLLLTVSQDRISSICIPAKVGNTWHPCSKKKEEEKYGGATKTLGKCEAEGKVPFISVGGLHQLHIFIFALAVSHVVYCILTMVLGKLKMRRWKRWEKETRTTEYQFSHDPERFRFARETSFGRRHLNFWSKTPILLWIVCFFRQFVRSVPKVDYLTLRHGFVMAHLAPHSHSKFDFQKYIKRSLEEDYTVVVGISPPIWFFAVLFLLFNTHGWYSYLWLPFIPLIIILLVGAKLQVIITKMGLRIQDRGDVVKGVPVVQPGDDLFWFNRPRLLLYLINFVLFQNAFQLAFFVWSWYEFGLQSCFHEEVEDIIIRVSMGVLIQILCSYVTFPLYALVTQMGSSMKPTIFNERVATALKTWHHTAKKHVKENRRSNLGTPESSRPGTPTRGLSPVHLLRNYRSEIPDSPSTPHRSGYDMDLWEADHGSPSTRSPSPRHVHHGEGSSSSHPQQIVELGGYVEHNAEAPEPSSLQIVPSSQPSRVQHEINISVHKDFSFDGRPKT